MGKDVLIVSWMSPAILSALSVGSDTIWIPLIVSYAAILLWDAMPARKMEPTASNVPSPSISTLLSPKISALFVRTLSTAVFSVRVLLYAWDARAVSSSTAISANFAPLSMTTAYFVKMGAPAQPAKADTTRMLVCVLSAIPTMWAVRNVVISTPVRNV